MHVYAIKYACTCSDGTVISNSKMCVCVCICVISKKYRSKFLSLQTLLKKRTTFLTFYVFAHISFLRVVDLATHSI